jgi:GH35 family endo-1,4-beta-xylanase
LNWYIEPGTNPLLYDSQLKPKPMYEAVLNELLAGRKGG